MMRQVKKQNDSKANISGFTLVELLVVITILVIILAITIPAVNFGLETERIRGGAGQVQSFIVGARDRAIYRKKPVGVRLFLDNVEYTDNAGNVLQGNRRTVSSMIYVDPAQTWSDGTIKMQRLDGNRNGVIDGTESNAVVVVAGSGTGWWELKRRGMLVDGLRIQIPAGGNWYPIDTRLIDTSVEPPRWQSLLLQIPYQDPGSSPAGFVAAFTQGDGPSDYVLELPPAIMPMEPSILPDSVVIDLDGSRIPASWAPSATVNSNAEFSQFMDIVFSPRGTIIGPAASAGVIHLYVCDSNDSVAIKELIALSVGNTNYDLTGFSGFLATEGVSQLIPAEVFEIDADSDGSVDEDEQVVIKDRRVVTIFTQTGAISVHPVNPEGAVLAADPFLFAETGQEAN